MAAETRASLSFGLRSALTPHHAGCSVVDTSFALVSVKEIRNRDGKNFPEKSICLAKTGFYARMALGLA